MRLSTFALLLIGAIANAQYYPGQSAGAGFPTPSWLKGTRTVTGYVGTMEPDRILVRTLDQGNILCHVDAKTKIHVEKTVMSAADLREGDPIAVRIKDVKDKGPYAVEIMPHPDVLARKQRGGTPEPAPEVAALPHTDLPPVERVTRMEAPPPGATADGIRSDTRGGAPPALPRGQKGLQGTIVLLDPSSGEAQLQLESGGKRTIQVTSVTRIARGAAPDSVLDDVRIGDRVAVVGDALDNGVYVAREVLVNRAEGAASIADRASADERRPAAKAAAALSGEFTGVVESVGADTLKVRVDDQVRLVTVTPITIIKKYNSDTPLAGLRKGDELKVTGDVLEDGSTLAREINVTKSGRQQ